MTEHIKKEEGVGPNKLQKKNNKHKSQSPFFVGRFIQ